MEGPICLIVLVLFPVIVSFRFYLEGRREAAKSRQTPANLAPPTQSLTVGRSKHPKPILYEERVYADVLPFVRIYQGLWLVGALFIGLYLVYGWLAGVVIMDGWVPLGTNLIGLIVFTAVLLWVSVALSKMSAPFGCMMLFVYVGGLLLALFNILLSAFFFAIELSQGQPSLNWYSVIPMILSGTTMVYLYYRGLRAGWRFAFSEDETKRIVSEIDPNSPGPSGWFSKALAMPIPKKHLRKNRALTTTLFIVSGLAFSSFAILVPLSAVLSGLLIARVLGWIATTRASWNISTLSPLIAGGLAIASLLVGLAARAGARRLMISSIRESQEYDTRPPILFLRSFRDDQVHLPTPRISLLGRLVNLFQRKGSLDIVLLEEGTAYGPVVAIGQPGEPVPPYGAARGYFADGDWKKAVAQLADDSRCIVICLDQTEGVLWEFNECILKRGNGPKTLFVMNPGAREIEKNKALLQALTAWMPSKPRELLLNHDEAVLGFFFDEGKYAKVGVSGQFSEASYLLMVRWFLRTAMDGCLQPN